MKVYIDDIDITRHISSGSVSMEFSEDNYCNTVDLSFVNMTLYDDHEPNNSHAERIKVEIGSETYKFLLEERTASISFIEDGYSVFGRSRAAILDAPYWHKCIDKIMRTVEDSDFAPEGNAKAVIDYFLDRFQIGIDVTYGIAGLPDLDMTDYHIPAKTLAVKDKSPLAIIQEIAAAAGCILRSGHANELIIRKKYIDVRKIQTYTPVCILDDYEHIITAGEEFARESNANGVVVDSGLDELQGNFELDEDIHKESNLIPYENVMLRLYLTPITPVGDYYIDQTDGQSAFGGIGYKYIKDEIVEFTDMKGNTQYPIYMHVDGHSAALDEPKITPRLTSGYSPEMFIHDSSLYGRFNFNHIAKFGGTPYPRHYFEILDPPKYAGTYAWYQLETIAQGGWWEDPPFDVEWNWILSIPRDEALVFITEHWRGDDEIIAAFMHCYDLSMDYASMYSYIKSQNLNTWRQVSCLPGEELLTYSDIYRNTRSGIHFQFEYEWLGDNGGSISVVRHGSNELKMSNSTLVGAVAKVSYETLYHRWNFSGLSHDVVKTFAIDRDPQALVWRIKKFI